MTHRFFFFFFFYQGYLAEYIAFSEEKLYVHVVKCTYVVELEST